MVLVCVDGESQSRSGSALFLTSEKELVLVGSWGWGQAELKVMLVWLGVQPKEEGPGLWLTSGRRSPFDLTQEVSTEPFL